MTNNESNDQANDASAIAERSTSDGIPSSGKSTRKAVWVEFAQIEAAAAEKTQLQHRLAELSEQRDAVWAEISKLESAIAAKVVLDARLSDVARESVAKVSIHPELTKLQTISAENANLNAQLAKLTEQRDAASAEVAQLFEQMNVQRQVSQAAFAQVKAAADAENSALLIAQLSELTQQRDAERAESHDRITQLEGAVAELTAQHDKLRAADRTELAELVEQLDAQSQTNQSALGQFNVAAEQNVALTAQLSVVTQQRDTERIESRAKITQFEGMLAELTKQYHSLRITDRAELAKELDTQRQANQSELAQLKAEAVQNAALTAQLTELTQQRDAERAEARAQIAQFENTLGELIQQHDDQRVADRAELAELTKQLDAQRQANQSELAQLKAGVVSSAELTAQLAELKQQRDAEQADLHAEMAELEGVAAEKAALETQLAELIKQHDSQRTVDRAELAELTKQLDIHQHNAETKFGQLDTLTTQNTLLNNRLMQLVKQRDGEQSSQRTEIAKLTRQMDDARTEATQLRAEVTQYKERAGKSDELRAQVTELRNKLVANEIEKMEIPRPITSEEVFYAADTLFQGGIIPTVANLHAKLGRGPRSTIQVELARWRLQQTRL